ncbi:MAG: undecaprenyl-diphosphate phosphatase [Anaerolineae bacterium]
MKTIILSIVEGITEFLPISSTGHLIVAGVLLDYPTNARETFELFIQFGAVVAIVIYYRVKLLDQVKRVRSDRGVQRLWLALIIATIPAGAIGFLTRSFIKANLFNPIVVAISLIVGGVVLILIERGRKTEPEGAINNLEDVSLRQAVVIGFAQVVALIPGVSRSAASIVGGMLSGLSRRTAAEFSFLLAIPTLGGATLADFLLSLDEIHSDQLIYFAVGLILSGVVAYIAVDWLLRYIQQHDFRAFGVYRIAAGALLLVLAALGIMNNA